MITRFCALVIAMAKLGIFCGVPLGFWWKYRINRETAAAELRAQRKREHEEEQAVIGDRIKRELMMERLTFEKPEPKKIIRYACGFLSDASAQELLK